MCIFLVAHGAWTGGWSWRKMRPLLRDRGHELHTPTMTGLGERAHLADPSIDLEIHVRDILNVLEFEDLEEVTLIGHSYGGMVATVLADRLPQRLSHVIYLDAFVPQHDQCLFDLLPQSAVTQMLEKMRESGDGWRVPPNPLPPDTPAKDVEWMLPRRQMQPVRTFEQRAHLRRSAPAPRRSYVYCSRAAAGNVFRTFMLRARSEAGWQHVMEIDASHNPHVTAAGELADLLDGIVGR